VTDSVDDELDYRRFFERSPEMLVTGTLDGYLKTVNDSFQRALGYDRDELLARPFSEFIHPDDRTATMQEMQKLAEGNSVVGFENRYRSKHGSYRWLRWSATAIPEDGLLYAIAHDVTESKNKDEALHRLLADLERSNEELSQFAYVASHDLAEPLRVVAGHVDLLSRHFDGRLDADAERYIEFAVEGCARMRILIDDLLAFSRAGREVAAEEWVDMTEVTTDVLASLAAMVAGSGATITVGHLPTVTWAPSQCAHVVANLVTNALKFHRLGFPPRISIAGHREETGWRIEVEDDGIGVEPDDRERIFRIFQRLHGPDVYPGTGIGLAICRKMVDLRGGRIWCAPAHPTGSTFCFTVPDRTGGES
jgi:PAS domain S-box-containing protein